MVQTATQHEAKTLYVLQTVHGMGTSLSLVLLYAMHDIARFPRVQDCGSFLDQFACEFAEYDTLQRSIKYNHPETQPDDALHATNYGLIVATRAHAIGNMYGRSSPFE